MGFHRAGRWPDAKERIIAEIKSRSGYDLKTFRARVSVNAYDALQVLKEIRHMASMAFFHTKLGISPYDFNRKPK